MTVDPQLVRRKASLILEDLKRLEPIARAPVDAFVGSLEEIVAERLLERMVGRMIDINYHLAVGSGRMPPKDYHESFLDLAELGVLSADAAGALARAAGIRNRLAHEYDGIDQRLVHAASVSSLSTVPDYLRAVEVWLSQPSAV